MMKNATLNLEDDDRIKKTLKSLVPEAEEGMKRVEVSLSYEPPKIIINAEDIRALRAALNSYLRWLDVSEKIIDID
ncbi:MAG: KEOPS complex subunit Pcc1 [Thermoplasmatota archaeon]